MSIIGQNEFVKPIPMIPTKTDYNSNLVLSNDKLKLCKSSIGKLNWLTSQTQPDLSYEISDLLKDRNVESISLVNKSARKAKKIFKLLILRQSCKNETGSI